MKYSLPLSFCPSPPPPFQKVPLHPRFCLNAISSEKYPAFCLKYELIAFWVGHKILYLKLLDYLYSFNQVRTGEQL